MAKELKIRITGDSSGLKKGTDEGEGILMKFGSRVSAWSVATGTLLADGIKTGLSAVGGFLGDSIGAATDINETISKVGVLFGDAAGEIEAFAKTAAVGLGQSQQQAMDAAATFATFGKGAGLSGSQLADFSIDLASLASDMASFNNTSPEQAIEAIGAALRGESEPIRAYGVLLDDATLRQKALELGITSTTKDALTPQQKVLAAQAAIFEQTTAAQGDFARTSDGLANQQRILGAQVDNLKARIGQGLLPVVQDIVSWANTKLIPAFSKLADVWVPRFSTAIKVLTSGFKNFADGRTTGGVFGFFEQVGIYIGRTVAWFQNLIGLFRSGGWKAALLEVGKTLANVWLAAADWLYTTALPAIGRFLVEVGKKFGTWVTETAVPYLAENLPIWLDTFTSWYNSTAAPWLRDRMIDAAKKLGEWIADAAIYLKDNLPGWIASFADWYYGTALPWLAEKTSELAQKFGDWVDDAAVRLLEKLPGWIGSFTEWFVGTALPWLTDKTAELQSKMVDWVADAAVDLAAKLPEWLNAFKNWATNEALPGMVSFGEDILRKLGEGVVGANSLLFDTGVQVVAGLIRGLESMGGELAAAARNVVASNIPGPVRDLLGISSPSKVFHEIGVQTAQGLAGGMLAGSGLVQSAATRMAGAAVVTPRLPGYTPVELSGGQAAGGWQQQQLLAVVQLDGRTFINATNRPAEYERRAGQ